MINLDKDRFDGSTISTLGHIEATLGEPEESDELKEACGDTWAMQRSDEIAAWAEKQTGQAYCVQGLNNTYNEPNDLSNEINYYILAPEDCTDYFWSQDCFVVLEIHRSGDVRGNYGSTEVFRVDDLGDCGFFDWSLGWSAETLQGEYVEVQEIGAGYSSEPTCEIRSHYVQERGSGSYQDPIMKWSDKKQGFLARSKDHGETHVLKPYTNNYR